MTASHYRIDGGIGALRFGQAYFWSSLLLHHWILGVHIHTDWFFWDDCSHHEILNVLEDAIGLSVSRFWHVCPGTSDNCGCRQLKSSKQLQRDFMLSFWTVCLRFSVVISGEYIWGLYAASFSTSSQICSATKVAEWIFHPWLVKMAFLP